MGIKNLANTVYSFTANDINGNPVSLEKYKGYVLLIANVASKCGYTVAGYHLLQSLSDKYYEKGLRILLFPCNQFLGQEPGSNAMINDYICAIGDKFETFAKIDVNGSNAHPLFEFLKSKCPGLLHSFIKWNFTKFLVNREGVPVKRFGPNENSLEGIEDDVVNLL